MKYQLHIGDALTILKTMPDRSVHCCVTSPPYWGLRDYGVDSQLGLEKTPDEYVMKMVEIFREIRRVLRDDGTLWLNLGDTYAMDTKWGGKTGWRHAAEKNGAAAYRIPRTSGLKNKDLVGIPWRVALSLQADGWYLRSDIIWNKPNPMPESVNDRPTRAHEYIFLMAKSERYYYDKAAIMEPVTGNAHARGTGVNPKARAAWKTPDGWDTSEGQGGHGSFHRNGREKGHAGYKVKQNPSFAAACNELVDSRNKRTVWTVPTHPFPQAHFATFPPDLMEPCVLAGCPEGGTVFDPFTGSGTTGEVALKNFRRFVGIELNPTYANEIAIPRIEREAMRFKQCGLFN